MWKLAVVLVVCVGCSKDRPAPEPVPAAHEAPEASRPRIPEPVADDGDEIRVTVQTRTAWLEVSRTSAVPVRRAVRPGTLEPYVDALPEVSQLRRRFVLDKSRVTLGEPVLVEMRIENDGAEVWQEPIGGNYRGRGRDDNFAFFLRRDDGTWAPDPYVGESFMGGGISTQYEVHRGDPRSYWLAVQRYAVIDEPGHYDLYCIQYEHAYDTVGWREALTAAIPERLASSHELDATTNRLVEKGTGAPTPLQMTPTMESVLAPPSPVSKRLPKQLYARMSEYTRDSVVDFAHFELTVTEPSASERDAMVAEWTRVTEVDPSVSWPTPRPHAAREAIWFSTTADFLSLVDRWVRDDDTALPQYLHGLALNPHAEAVDVLMRSANANAIAALYYLRPKHRSLVIPKLIPLLTDADDGVRSYAFDRLAAWSEQRFGVDWDGYIRGRPTVDEGRALQPAIRTWWRSQLDN